MDKITLFSYHYRLKFELNDEAQNIILLYVFLREWNSWNATNSSNENVNGTTDWNDLETDNNAITWFSRAPQRSTQLFVVFPHLL